MFAVKFILRYGFGYIGLSIGILILALLTTVQVGLVSPYPQVPQNQIPAHYTPINDVRSLYKKENEPIDHYYERLTQNVYQGIVQYWKTSTENRRNYTQVSILDNYLLWAYAQLPNHTHFQQYEFALPQKAINRGIGLCSQLSRIIYYILEDQGIDATVLSQPEHVIVQVNDIILDPTYGVVLPFSAQNIANANIPLTDYYASSTSGDNLALIENLYTRSWDIPENHDALYDYMYKMELYAEILKWLIPSLMVLCGLFFIYKSRPAFDA